MKPTITLFLRVTAYVGRGTKLLTINYSLLTTLVLLFIVGGCAQMDKNDRFLLSKPSAINCISINKNKYSYEGGIDLLVGKKGNEVIYRIGEEENVVSLQQFLNHLQDVTYNSIHTTVYLRLQMDKEVTLEYFWPIYAGLRENNVWKIYHSVNCTDTSQNGFLMQSVLGKEGAELQKEINSMY